MLILCSHTTDPRTEAAIDSLLLGVIVCQMIQYRTLAFEDSRLTHATVGYIGVVSVVSTALDWSWAYHIVSPEG